MKNILILIFMSACFMATAQKKTTLKKSTVASKKSSAISNDLQKINDSIPALIPQKINGRFGYINQHSKLIIKPEYSNVGFFTEDCSLSNSANANIRKFGSNKYASVRFNGLDFRIDQKGKRVYQFKDTDLGKCDKKFQAQLFHAYIFNKKYGIIEDSKFDNPYDYKQFTIYPQYEYLHIMEGDDLKNPMIIAVSNEKFGVIDIYQNVIIPFEYAEIKRNFSWKLARLFEVSSDGENYYFVDINNKKY